MKIKDISFQLIKNDNSQNKSVKILNPSINNYTNKGKIFYGNNHQNFYFFIIIYLQDDQIKSEKTAEDHKDSELKDNPQMSSSKKYLKKIKEIITPFYFYQTKLDVNLI